MTPSTLYSVPLSVGDIVQARRVDGSDYHLRFFVVVAILGGKGPEPTIRAAALSDAIANASERDLLLEGDQIASVQQQNASALGKHKWMVELWNTRAVRIEAIEGPIARLTPSAIRLAEDSIHALAYGNPLPKEAQIGQPLQGRDDPRADFQREELRQTGFISKGLFVGDSIAVDPARPSQHKGNIDKLAREAAGNTGAAQRVRETTSPRGTNAPSEHNTEHLKIEQWTNASVLRFASSHDPVNAITERARQVVLEALDQGWQGPPFDPIGLADVLGIPVVPSAGVADARAVPTREGVRIEFNPNRSAGRRRFSIAHEIAHTFFPDHAEQVRYRSPHLPKEQARDGAAESDDGWQLEALCNIAAAELLMPTISLPALRGLSDLHLGRLMEIRRQFDVSAEALLLRVVRLSSAPCAIFSASKHRADGGASERIWDESDATTAPSEYRIDYVVGSRTWRSVISRGIPLSSRSVVAQCTGIGTMRAGIESWAGEAVAVEAVGIPPFPGSAMPRVVGILTEEADRGAEPFLLREVEGDATVPIGGGVQLIVHLVNDRTANWGPDGFAAALRRRYPQVQTDFRDWVANSPKALRLGNVRIAHAEGDVWVATVVAQRNYGASAGPRRLRYLALQEGLQFVAQWALREHASVHMPRIGTGQAGGNWGIIRDLIAENLTSSGLPVTVYRLPGAAPEEVSDPQLSLLPQKGVA